VQWGEGGRRASGGGLAFGVIAKKRSIRFKSKGYSPRDRLGEYKSLEGLSLEV